MARDLDVLFLSIGVAALAGAVVAVAIWWARVRRHTFRSTIACAAVGSAVGAGIVGVIAACIVDPGIEAVISAPIAFLMAGVLGLPVGVFIGSITGIVVRQQKNSV